MTEKILVIAPHQDDEVLGCGGVMARHAAEGDHVQVLIVTRGIPELFPEHVIETTRQELFEAHRLLGVEKTQFLELPAPALDTVPIYQITDQIHKIMSEFRPTRLYLPHRGDIHNDHVLVFNAAMVAARPIGDYSVQSIYAYETLSETEWSYPFGNDPFVPTVYVNISDYLDKKLEAMACYQSQLKEKPHPRSLWGIEVLAQSRGSVVSYEAAEAFLLIRDCRP